MFFERSDELIIWAELGHSDEVVSPILQKFR